jgi:hypothetical protein
LVTETIAMEPRTINATTIGTSRGRNAGKDAHANWLGSMLNGFV